MNRPLFEGSYLHARRRLSANEKEEKVYQGWFLVSLMHNCVQYLPLSLPEKEKDQIRQKIKIIFQFVKCCKTNSTW